MPEKGDFQIEPVERKPNFPQLSEPNCRIAKDISKDLLRQNLRSGCESDFDCVEVLHPIGCETVINVKNLHFFESKVAYIEQAKKRTDSTCGIPIAKCRSSEKLPTCNYGMCKFAYRN